MKKKPFSKSKFKVKSQALLEQDSRTGKTITVTKRDKPIAGVVPLTRAKEKPVPGKLRDTLVEETDLVTPFDTDLWKAGKPK